MVANWVPFRGIRAETRVIFGGTYLRNQAAPDHETGTQRRALTRASRIWSRMRQIRPGRFSRAVLVQHLLTPWALAFACLSIQRCKGVIPRIKGPLGLIRPRGSCGNMGCLNSCTKSWGQTPQPQAQGRGPSPTCYQLPWQYLDSRYNMATPWLPMRGREPLYTSWDPWEAPWGISTQVEK